MRALYRLAAGLLGAVYVIAFLSGVGCSSTPPPEHEAVGVQLFESPQAQPIVLSPDGTRLYAVLTTMGKVRVINTATMNSIAMIEVGVDPVSVALRPDGSELWVANHVSDSVSVISLAAGASQHKVVETIQAVDTANLVTDFDEPAGIAFASNSKAYVALSSRNRIAVVDADSYTVTGFLAMNAQEPRAMVVRGGRLYVPAFESGNRSELSSCVGAPVPGDDQCTFDFTQSNFATNPQLIGFDVDIAIDPIMPDRDLYVFDTATDAEVEVVEGVGTLLYGLAVSGAGKVFVAQTEARNAVNGRAGTLGHTLADLDNRMFLNQIGVVDCSGASCADPTRFELEALPPAQPAPGTQLATPYALELSANDQILVGTAASSNRVFVANAGTGAVLARVEVGNGPRGLALHSDPGTGAPLTAYVLNTLDDSISTIDLSDLGEIPAPTTRAYNGDTAPLAIREGRIAFNDAAASTTGTFSCASCHPDGHVDQLLWVIGARCTFEGCDQEEPRSTMPVRGLKNTQPLHWDGTLGDPFNGRNGETGVNATEPRNCTDDPGCFRQLVDASLSGVMCDQAPGGCPTNDAGQPGGLTGAERDAMATYLQAIQYPPPRSRRFDDQLTAQAVAGFSDFFENKGGVNPPGGSELGPETCGDVGNGGCHALPHGVGTASFFVGGFEAPTMRGITDRYLEFSAGVTVVRDVLQAVSFDPPGPTPPGTEVPWSPAVGFDELTTWAVAFGSSSNNTGFRSAYNVGGLDIFQMIEEMSNGQSGAFARQVTLNLRSTAPGALAGTEALVAVLETADLNGLANLRAVGVRGGSALTLSFRGNGLYQGQGLVFTRAQLIAEAQAGTTLLTLTAQQRASVTSATVQPTLWVRAAFQDPQIGGTFLTNGRPDLPLLPGDDPMLLLSENVPPGSKVLIDGAPVAATLSCVGSVVNGLCDGSGVSVDLAAPPAAPGMYLLQVQTSDGLLSNEVPVRRQ